MATFLTDIQVTELREFPLLLNFTLQEAQRLINRYSQLNDNVDKQVAWLNDVINYFDVANNREIQITTP